VCKGLARGRGGRPENNTLVTKRLHNGTNCQANVSIGNRELGALLTVHLYPAFPFLELLGIGRLDRTTREWRLRGRRVPDRGEELDIDVGEKGERSNLRLEGKVCWVIHELDDWQFEIVRRRKEVRWAALESTCGDTELQHTKNDRRRGRDAFNRLGEDIFQSFKERFRKCPLDLDIDWAPKRQGLFQAFDSSSSRRFLEDGM